MILKQYILLLALLFSGLSFAVGMSNSKEKSRSSSKAWNQKFDAYLLDHPDPYVQAIGLIRSQWRFSHLIRDDVRISMFNNIFNKDSVINDARQNFVNHINKLAQYNSLSSETIHLLLSLCANDAIRDSCHRQMLLNKHKQQYPYDLSVYLEPLTTAMNNNNTSMAEYLIKNMRDAKYITETGVLPTVFESTVKNYIDEHPLPRLVLLEQLDHFTNIDGTTADKTLNNTYYYHILDHIKLELPTPSERGLTDYCSSNSNDISNCIDISNTLIHKGKNLTTRATGYRLKVKTYENSLLTDKLIRAKEADTFIRTYYKCIEDAFAKNLKMADYLDATSRSRLWYNAYDEIERIKSLALYLYEKGLTEGVIGGLNPEDCEANQEQINNSL